MKRILIVLLGLAACDSQTGSGFDLSGGVDMAQSGNEVNVSGEITQNTTWTADKTYLLKSHVFVRGTTLTIEPGTIIHGEFGTSLVITNDAKIDAQGTAQKPIVFTSANPVGTRKKGDWGGVILLGKAKINAGSAPDGMKTQLIEGFPATEMRVSYGGNDDTHDCGKLKYVRIEFAGFEIATDKEINSLTVGACGSNTQLDYIQTHKGSDDGIEFFGGTANLKHALVIQPNDDGLDWDFGWTGKVQFVIVQQSKADGNFGYESDNNKNAQDALPRSQPTIYNATLIGSGPGAASVAQGGMLLRVGTAGKMYNHIIAYFTDFPIDIKNSSTVTQANDGNLLVNNSIFFSNNKDGQDDTDTTETDNGGKAIDEGEFFSSKSAQNLVVDPQLPAAMNLTAPNWKPAVGSPALVEANAALIPKDSFFEEAPFIGAIGTTDWTVGWTAYPEN